MHLLSQRGAKTRYLGDLLDSGGTYLRHGSEVFHQLLAAFRPQPRHLIQDGSAHPLAALLTVEIDREAVRLIADVLHELEGVGIARNDHRVRVLGQPQFLQSLSDAHEGDVVDPQFV